MNNIILCEGFDDVYILGYYIYKTSNKPKWEYNNKVILSENFSLPKIDPRNQKIEYYVRENHKLVIWCVGGKDNFNDALKAIYTFNTSSPNERFKEIIIFADRDERSIDDCVKNLSQEFTDLGWNMELTNNVQNVFN